MKLAPHYLLLALSQIVPAVAHEKHGPAKDYQPPKEAVVIGEGEFRYKLVPGWATENAEKFKLGHCHAIQQDSRGRILLLHTSKEHCLIALSQDGKVLDAWGDFTNSAHGLAVVKEKGREVLFITDNSGNGKVYKTTLDGKVLMTISCPMESRLYANPNDFKPSKTLHLPNGDILVMDGYGKDYVHRFNSEGKWQSSFGGNLGEGEAKLKHWGPHGGGLDLRDPKNPVVILGLSDQQKMKRFKPDGTWIDTIPFPGGNPRDLFFHRGHHFMVHLGDNWPADRNAAGYLSVLDQDLKVVANLGGGPALYDGDGKLKKMGHSTHLFHHPHGACADKEGNLYVAQFASNGTWPLKFVPLPGDQESRVEPLESEGRTWIVSTLGKDEAEGSEDAPFRTISRAAQGALPGDTILVKAGVYRERVAPPRGGEPGKPITYRGEKLGKVFIRGSNEWHAEWRAHRGTVYHDVVEDEFLGDDDSYVDSANPLRVPLASTPYNRDGQPEFERLKKGDPNLVYTCGQIIVNGKLWEQRPFLSEVEKQPHTWSYDQKSRRVYLNFGKLAPADQKVEITSRRRIFAPHVRGLGHLVVENFVMEHCGNQYPTNFWKTSEWAQAGALGLRGGHHWIVRNNLIRYANTMAMDVGRGGGDNERVSPTVQDDTPGANNLIENNYLVDNGAAGIVGADTRGMVVRGNVIMRNNTLRFIGKKRFEHAGLKFHYVNDATIEGNYVADSPRSAGIWLDNQFAGTRVTRNVVVNNGERGIFLEMSDYKFDAVLVDHNISLGNGTSQFYVHDASGSTVMHNLFANSPKNAKYGQGAYIFQVDPRTKTGYHSLYNNIFVNHRAMMDINYPSHRSGPQRLDHNIYDAVPGERAFRINSSSDDPSPWQPAEFFALVSHDLGKDWSPKPLRGGAKVAMTLEEWRAFWAAHDLRNDVHSVTRRGMEVAYDQDRLELVVTLGFDPAIGSTDHAGMDRDFTGAPVPQNGKAIPGPLQSLREGMNVVGVWKGLPLLERGELP